MVPVTHQVIGGYPDISLGVYCPEQSVMTSSSAAVCPVTLRRSQANDSTNRLEIAAPSLPMVCPGKVCRIAVPFPSSSPEVASHEHLGRFALHGHSFPTTTRSVTGASELRWPFGAVGGEPLRGGFEKHRC